jgi:peptidoglycan/LPS O-acetylase OafA/YrhL
MDGVTTRRLGYRPPLDGVRAVAIAMVMLVHTDRRLVPNGGLGVDIFFVLSGFLITTLLLEEAALTNTLAIGKFYARRALRLLPALYSMLAVVLIYALIVASPHARHDILGEIPSSALYVRNWSSAWWNIQGIYLKPTWSLALEEQFYLIWPPLLYFGFLRRQRENLLPAALVTILVIFGLMRVATIEPTLLVQRPDALFVGCLAAALLHRRDPALEPSRTSGLLRFGAIVGAIVLVVVAMSRSLTARFFNHGGYLLVAASVALVIVDLVLAPRSAGARLLAISPMVYIGKISYALYLWHVPIYKMFRDGNLGLPNIINVPAKVGITFLVATTSYYLVEQPALRMKARLSPLYARGTPAEASNKPV